MIWRLRGSNLGSRLQTAPRPAQRNGAFLQAIIHTHALTIHAPPSRILDPNHVQVLQSIGVLVGQAVYANASSKESKSDQTMRRKKESRQSTSTASPGQIIPAPSHPLDAATS